VGGVGVGRVGAGAHRSIVGAGPLSYRGEGHLSRRAYSGAARTRKTIRGRRKCLPGNNISTSFKIKNIYSFLRHFSPPFRP